MRRVVIHSILPALFVIAALLPRPLLADEKTDAAVKAIREMSLRAGTFEVELVHSGGNAKQRVRTLAAYRGLDLCRLQLWTQEARKEGVVQNLTADRLYAGDTVTELSNRAVDEWKMPKFFFLSDYRLFPLYVDRAFRVCKLDSVVAKADAIEVRWLNPEGKWDKVITARFAPQPPYDMLSVAAGVQRGEFTSAVNFSDYGDVGGGFRFPARMEWAVRNGETGVVSEFPSIAKLLQANAEIPNERFILRIPPGTTMPDETVTKGIVVVDGNKGRK